MSYWDGTRWTRESEAPTERRSRATWPATLVMLLGLAAILFPSQGALAASRHKADPPCTVSPSPAAVDSWVTLGATGLPTVDPVYLIIQPPTGVSTVGEVYVNQSTGTWSGPEFVDQSGTWTYTFSGLIGKRYGTASACSLVVN